MKLFRIDYDWKEPPMKKARKFLGWFRHQPVPMCHSNHYVRSHFHDDGQPKLF